MSILTSRFHQMQNPRNYLWLIIGICGISGLGWLINSFDPNYLLPLVLFFLLLFITIFSLSFFITNIVRRSILIGSGVFVFSLLRFFGLREWYYALLLIVCLILIELSFQNQKR